MEIVGLQLEDLSIKDQKNIEGGVVPIIIVGGIYAGALLGGAAVGYGTYKLVDWVFN